MNWYEKLNCEELLKVLVEVANELEKRSITYYESCEREDDMQIAIDETIHSHYTVYPNTNEVYCW